MIDEELACTEVFDSAVRLVLDPKGLVEVVELSNDCLEPWRPAEVT